MKPCSSRVLNSSVSYSEHSVYVGVGFSKVTRISGVVKKLSNTYKKATVVLFDKSRFSAIAVRRPDSNGAYSFPSLNSNLTCFVIAFDESKQFNAVIQDNVVPK